MRFPRQGPPGGQTAPPPLSYVFAAISRDEVQQVARWLWDATIGPEVEVVLAAPARLLSHTAAGIVPRRVRLASCRQGEDRLAVRRSGAAITTGLVVIVVDCEDGFAARIRGPLAGGDAKLAAAGSPELARWAAELDRIPAALSDT